MGCVWGRPSGTEKGKDSRIERLPNKASPNARLFRAASSKKVVLLDKQANDSQRMNRDYNDKKVGVAPHLYIGHVGKAAEGEYVAAGWPPWLASEAREAIRGWLPRRADSFQRLGKIGQGTYSNVYLARDLDQRKLVALKKLKLDNLEPESVRFMAREIHILRQLDHPNVIKLEGLVTPRMSCSLFLVLEYMEHDLTGLVSNSDFKLPEPQVKCYMQQLLRGLDHCHSRGVLHRDIKGSNLLIDNNGILKIADFGLARFYDPHQSQPLTSRVVTLWYRPPELLLGETNYGPPVDLWSTGCVLAELYARKPIMTGRTEVEQLHIIFKLCGSPSEEYWRKSKFPNATIFKPQQSYKRCVAETFKKFPAPALALVEFLLSIDPANRGTAASALGSEFFTSEPLPCDPSSLPEYPPSKELDAKMRIEEARRRRESAIKGQKDDQEKGGCMVVAGPVANFEFTVSMERRQAQSSSKCESKKFKPDGEEVASGSKNYPDLNPLFHHSSKKSEEVSQISTRADSSAIPSSTASRRSFLSQEHRNSSFPAQREASRITKRFPGSLKEAPGFPIQEEYSLGVADAHQKDDHRNKKKDPALVSSRNYRKKKQ